LPQLANRNSSIRFAANALCIFEQAGALLFRKLDANGLPAKWDQLQCNRPCAVSRVIQTRVKLQLNFV
jgi:hypothetical protein